MPETELNDDDLVDYEEAEEEAPKGDDLKK